MRKCLNDERDRPVSDAARRAYVSVGMRRKFLSTEIGAPNERVLAGTLKGSQVDCSY